MVAIRATVTALDIILGVILVLASIKSKSKALCGIMAALIAVNAVLVWY